LNFTANGGDAHVVLKAAKGVRIDTGLVDLDALIDYVKAHVPLSVDEPHRIKVK
jgi:5'-nucleotidase